MINLATQIARLRRSDRDKDDSRIGLVKKNLPDGKENGVSAEISAETFPVGSWNAKAQARIIDMADGKVIGPIGN